MSTDDEYADRLRELLRAEADAVMPAADGLARIRERSARRGAVMRWARPLAVVGGAVAAAAVAIGFALTGNDSDRLHQNPFPPAASSTETPTSTPSAQPPPIGPAPTLAAGLPVWPYADGFAAAAGKSNPIGDGSPASVALHFTMDHLGFTDNTLALATSTSVDGGQAWVNIGYHTEATRTSTAAVVHLARWSNGPWEVVGTRDTTLTLTQPSYGAAASSPITAGGKITGVDESIRVAVHQSSSDQPLGVGCCVPAGGNATPWSETVTYKSSSASVLTVVASTGGHLIEHERWAITAVRNNQASSNSSAAPATFVAVSQQRIGVFRTSDGSRVRWLTTPQPGGGASDPQVVGSQVYFLRGDGTCANHLARVPLAGGTEHAVYTPSGATISGFGVSPSGRLAMNLVRCSDSKQRLFMLDPATGHSHGTTYMGAPPLVEGNPAWAPDNVHVAIVVRTGTQAQVRFIDAFATSSVLSGSTPCGNAPSRLPKAVTYSGATLMMAFETGGAMSVAKCTGTTVQSALFSAAITSPDNFAADGSGNVIFGGPTSGNVEKIGIWSGSQLRLMSPTGVSQPSW